jgi:hypothetical protein
MCASAALELAVMVTILVTPGSLGEGTCCMPWPA